ncbi:MAG: response regulator transcription factor [Candidatus Limnocylindrales bacterium]
MASHGRGSIRGHDMAIRDAASGRSNQDTRQGLSDEPGFAVPCIRVLVVDHSDVVRRGLREILAEEPSLEVVGTLASGAEAVAACRSLDPDVLIMDAALPDRGGYEASRRIRAESSRPAIVMLSSFDDASHALDAFASGANGYLSKDVSRADLVATIHRAATGETSVDPILGARLLQALAGPSSPTANTPDCLTPRELDVLRLLACGQTNKEIANRLILAVGTVKVHVERIFGKLGTTNRSEAAVRAIELGIVDPSGEVVAGSRWDTNPASRRN